MITTRSRFRGAMLGLACGDAVGTSVEFQPRGSFPEVKDMNGGGPFRLQPGQWTDDTSMALCLAESLIFQAAFSARDQMGRYLNWWKHGYMSSTGECFDIGITTQTALRSFEVTQDPFSGSTDSRTAGNGSLMRLAPIALFAFPNRELTIKLAAQSSRTTHGATEAVECCQLLAETVFLLLSGESLNELLTKLQFSPQEPKVAAVISQDIHSKKRDQIRGTGYCVESLEAALWCLLTTNTFEDAVLRAVNLGDDADTTGAIVGQMAGALYGTEGIPHLWLKKLAMHNDIVSMADQLLKLSETNHHCS